jgi:hypothetical protein
MKIYNENKKSEGADEGEGEGDAEEEGVEAMEVE